MNVMCFDYKLGNLNMHGLPVIVPIMQRRRGNEYCMAPIRSVSVSSGYVLPTAFF